MEALCLPKLTRTSRRDALTKIRAALVCVALSHGMSVPKLAYHYWLITQSATARWIVCALSKTRMLRLLPAWHAKPRLGLCLRKPRQDRATQQLGTALV